MQRSVIETILGAVVLLVAGVFLAFAWSGAQVRTEVGYTLDARFNTVDGLTVGSDVRLGGVKVGSVVDQEIDPETFQAVVRVSIREEVRLPVDTRAVIASAGLLGGRYVNLEPGRADAMLGAGDSFASTRDAVSLEDLLGRVIFLVTDTDAGS